MKHSILTSSIILVRSSTLLLGFVLFLSACSVTAPHDGKLLYEANCASCHLDDGQGLGALIPPLAGSDYLQKHRAQLPCIIRYGLADAIVVNNKGYQEQMAGNEKLSDIEITNILNYITNSWGNSQEKFKLEEVREILPKCQLKEAWGIRE